MFWLLAILAYLLGSLSFAILLSRLTGQPRPANERLRQCRRDQHAAPGR